jgi:hypothetical protein
MSEIKVFDGGDIELPFGNVQAVLTRIEEKADVILADN